MISTKPLGRSAQAVYQKLRQEILGGQLPPRSVLQQVELAERLGVSRTPVREALQSLAYDGLIELLSGQTARVTAISLKDSVEIRQIRVWLEVPTFELALRRRDQRADLLRILEEIEVLGPEPTPEACEQLLVLDEAFHRWSLGAAGNKRVEQIVGRLLDIIYLEQAFNVANTYRVTWDNLVAIRAAVESDDLDAVRRLLVEHIAGDNPIIVGPVNG